MKRRFFCFLLLIFCLFSFVNKVTVYADEQIYLGGMPAGFSLESRGAYVVGLSDVITEEGIKSPSKDKGIEIGDIILSINSIDVNNALDVSNALINGDEKILIVKRGRENLIFNVKPEKDVSGIYKLGVFIRDNINGIGTITYIKGNKFASLGHPVIDDTGEIMDVLSGTLFNCNITGCVKGERGKPGELRAVFLKTKNLGTIESNTDCGVYGTVDLDQFDKSKLIKVEKGEAKVGNAFIYSTVFGSEPKEYSISIIKVDESNETKNFVIKITDKDLLEITSGIVQGMSGSPIIQNGKIVGAVTHVFINDPTRGFGISIENMLR